MSSKGLHDESSSALNLVQLLPLGKLKQGTITTLSKFKYQYASWFNQSKMKNNTDKEETLICKENLYIQPDSFIQIRCKKGKSESTENYRVLAFFLKTNNKWYPAKND